MQLLTANDLHLATDRPLDFTMREYQWREVPGSDALSAASLLGVSTIAVEGSLGMQRSLASLRSSLGRCRTVWAAVDRAGECSWELYWYNREGLGVVEVAEILDRLGIEPSGTWVADIPSRPDVFSIDVDPALLNGQRRLEAINLYVGNPASRVPAGFSYRWTANGPTLSNVYQRFPRSMAESAHAQLSAALHVDDVGRLLWDGLLPCDSLHVANKSRSDGLYYGGLDSAGLACVLERTKSHHQIQAYLPNAGSRLQHLCFDVGIDIQRGRSGYAKVAIYGVL